MGLAMAHCLNHDTCQVPSTVETLQGCILQCLADENVDVFPCVKSSAISEQKAYLINILVDKCLQNENMAVCFKDTFLETMGPACPLLQKQSIANKLSGCFQQCSLKPISKPQDNPSKFDGLAALMTSHRQKRSYKEPSGICGDPRRTGLLCTHLHERYLTAGNSLCRPDHPCNYYGKEYYWCYTSYNNHWDYCCTGRCGYQGYDYLWCQVLKREWQRCGEGGTITTGANANGIPRQCLADHPCGLHSDDKAIDYYWCYYDLHGNWDYCCSPEPDYNTCDYHNGTDYKWCKTGNYKSYGETKNDWQYCYYQQCEDPRRTGSLCLVLYLEDRDLTAGNSLCRPDHPCDYHGYPHDYRGFDHFQWCYTSLENYWEYCCMNHCGYNDGTDYLWCRAGVHKGTFCGEGGTITTGARANGIPRQCLADHPCGPHAEGGDLIDYFWCYYHVHLNWDLCCSPEPKYNTCNNHGGTTDKWCKTGIGKSYRYGKVSWQYCYN